MKQSDIEIQKLNQSIQKLNIEKQHARVLLKLSKNLPKVQAVYKSTIQDYINHITDTNNIF